MFSTSFVDPRQWWTDIIYWQFQKTNLFRVWYIWRYKLMFLEYISIEIRIVFYSASLLILNWHLTTPKEKRQIFVIFHGLSKYVNFKQYHKIKVRTPWMSGFFIVMKHHSQCTNERTHSFLFECMYSWRVRKFVFKREYDLFNAIGKYPNTNYYTGTPRSATQTNLRCVDEMSRGQFISKYAFLIQRM